jgi:integral membrane sensor domain MASE1
MSIGCFRQNMPGTLRSQDMPDGFVIAPRASLPSQPEPEATPKIRFLRDFAAIVLVAVAYTLAGKLGLRLAFANPSATAVWPPTGIALAAFLLIGYRAWPGILVAAFLTNITTAGGIATSASIAVGNTLEGLLGAYLVNHFAGGLRSFERTRDVLKFVFLGAILSTLVSATCGAISLVFSGLARWSDSGTIWLTWWLGDATGDLIVAPLLILWATSKIVSYNRKHVLEAGALALLLLFMGEIVFGGLFPSSFKHYPLEFLCIPCLIWAALRFGQREVATVIFLLSGIAIRGTLLGFGPFVGKTQNESLLLLQAFMGVTAVMTMTLATIVAERRRAEIDREELILELQEALSRIKTLRGLLPICAVCKNIRDDRGYWNDIESYIRAHSHADFTHGICPACAKRLYPEEWKNAS